MIVERQINASAAAVWSHLGSLDRWAELLPTVDGIERVGEAGPIAVGSRFVVRQSGLATAVYEVTDWRPGHGFTWTAAASGVRTEASHELRPSGEGTRLVLAIEWTGPAAWLAKAFFSRKARAYMEREAEAFAALAEQG